MTIVEYLNLITSAFRQKPKFTATVTANVSTPVRIQELLLSMIPLFDVDAARGDQLDVIGKWVGISRHLTTPISGAYFSWDGAASVGWEYGIWQANLAPGEITTLPDDVYRTVIKAKIAANHWDGTIDGAYAVWDEIFTQITILIKDNQDMTYELGFVGGTLDTLTLALVTQGYIPLKPEGVRLIGVFTPANDGPLFAWDVDSELLQGWDTGSWVIQTPVT